METAEEPQTVTDLTFDELDIFILYRKFSPEKQSLTLENLKSIVKRKELNR